MIVLLGQAARLRAQPLSESLSGTDPVAASAPAVQAATTSSPVSQPAPIYSIAPAVNAERAVIGSNVPASGYKVEARLTPIGAGIWWAGLTDYKWKVEKDDPYAVLRQISPDGGKTALYHLAARSITINGQNIYLQPASWTLDAGPTPGSATYALTIVDSRSRPVVRISRTFTIEPGSYDVLCLQRIENKTATPLRIIWEQNAQGDVGDVATDDTSEKRDFLAGYHDLVYNPSRQFIYTKDTLDSRANVLDAFLKEGRGYWPTKNLPEKHELVWIASLSRYFAAAVHPVVPAPVAAGASAGAPPATNSAPVAALDRIFSTIGMQVIGSQVSGQPDTRVLVFTLLTPEITLAPAASENINLALFVGPRNNKLFTAEPYESLSFSQMVIYNLGGPCSFCTFQWLAKGMLGFMNAIHYVFRDWGVAVIILTLVVRGILHPITKRSQISMTKMSKQMASMQPEIEKLKKKYKDDQPKLQAETMKLYREKGVNPAGMLGCLPMFLQMPIWIALYAMLYYAIELRHQPAFYNFFHGISTLWGGQWQFLTDLSSPDNFIKFAGDGYRLDLWLIKPHITGINIIPLLMAVLFYFQQKYTTPPPANEQAAQQQKMMKWMTLLFPAFLYSAPCGLTLYIMASTAAGIVDSQIVKRHIKKEEEAGTLFAPSPRKVGGFMERIQKAVEERQRTAATKKKR